MEMLFYIYNKSLSIVGVIDVYKSAIWVERYYTDGDFELYVPATSKNMNILQKEYIVARKDTYNYRTHRAKAAIIEKVQITTDAENGDYMIVTGRSISSILSRRIMWKQTRYSGRVEKAIRRMIIDNCISPSIAARTIPNLSLGEEAGITLTFQTQMTGDNIGTALTEICKSYGLGYDVELDMDEKAFIFKVYKGVDRSYSQHENPYVVFSPNFENLISSEYSNDESNYKTTAQIAGEGEGVDRVKTAIGNSISGLNRFELFVDARDLSSNNGELTSEEYQALLEQRGRDKLAEAGITESLNSEVASSQTYKLGEDYFIGDIVEVKNDFGMSMTPRVTEVIECHDDTGYTCIPTFSTED